MVLACGLPVAEVAGLLAVNWTSLTGIAVHVTAAPPFGVYHDLRWVLTFHDSWPAFAGELIGLVLFRAFLGTALVILTWPTGTKRPPTSRLLVSQALFTVLAIVLLSPWAALAFASAATSLSSFMLASLLPIFLLGLVLNRGGLAPGWWRHPPSPRTLLLGVLAFVVLSGGSAAVTEMPSWWKLPVSALGGLANWWVWRRLVRTVACTAPPRVPAFLTPALAFLLTAGLLAAGQLLPALGGAAAPPTSTRPPADRLPRTEGRQILYVHGHGSSYHGEEVVGYPPDLVITHFSYRGQFPNGAPRPYRPAATHQSLPHLSELLAQQVAWLHQRSGKKITLVAESEGTLITRTYLRTHPQAPVSTLVMFSPLLRPARVYYPPQKSEQGWGIGAGWTARMLVRMYRWETPSTADADEPFVRSLIDHAPRYRTTMSCAVPGVHTIAFVPSAAAVVVPPGQDSRLPMVELPGLHGTLTHPQGSRSKIVAALRGETLHSTDLTLFYAVQAASAGWQAPPLPLTYVPQWKSELPPVC